VSEARKREIEQLYQAALACAPRERTALLDRSSPELKREVERMLADHASASDPTIGPHRPNTTADSIQPGTRLGRYDIQASLGIGGMGQVFSARDSQLGRMVAIKTSNELFQSRFQIEARAISALNHPHVCTLYDVGPNYFVMELVEGQTLEARLKLGPLPLGEGLRFAAQIADALADAHAHGIVHRDLKPANIMLTRHGVKVLDFGLARLLEETSVTEVHTVLGTPAYMAPEQAEGLEPTSSTDLFAFGLVLYEMFAGMPPVPGASLGRMLASGASAPIVPLAQCRRDLPPEIDALMCLFLAKAPSDRPRSALDVARQLSAVFARCSAPPASARLRPLAMAGAAALALLLLAGGLLFRRIEQVRWVREQAIPQITLLSSNQPLAAFLLLRRAQAILAGDPALTTLQASLTRLVSVASNPAGARVAIQDYLQPGAWFTLGSTPLRNQRVPRGYLRWRVSKPGEGAFVAAPPTAAAMHFALASVHRLSASGMVPVPGGPLYDWIDWLGWVIVKLPDYQMDRSEVTNGQFQQFVDQGGYQRRQFWQQPFLNHGKALSWPQAMALLRDRNGRPGPSTWIAGHFPPGQANFPVSGVSWYEAAAYAAFASKSLPVLAQFYNAAPPDLAPQAANAGNFSGRGPVPVGSLAAVGPYGTSDLVGNVREWSLNATGDQRFILGGAWNTQPYQAFGPESLPPFDRSPMNGFRTVRNLRPLPSAATAPLTPRRRDFSHAHPAPDQVFRAYKSMYAYDSAPLDPQVQAKIAETPDWTEQEITVDAGYDHERLPMFLFLPKRVRPPFQTVLFFPSARVELLPDSHVLGDMQFVDYVIQSGRALLYPIYRGTYGRDINPGLALDTIGDLQLSIKRSKEVRRAFDYLATRPDLDASKVAYLGVSMGAAFGVIYTTLEPRFRTAIFLDGGMFLTAEPPGGDQVDFAPRLKIPVLMVNGKYDFSFSPELSQQPLFALLGTKAADKKRVVLDSPHDVSQQKAALSQAVLAWLDKYLGSVSY